MTSENLAEKNWPNHPATQGLSDAGRCVIGHSTLAVTPERLPLGLLAQRNWVRGDATFGVLPSNKKRAVRARKGERGLWQWRFWEHTIRNEHDYANALAIRRMSPSTPIHPGKTLWPSCRWKQSAPDDRAKSIPVAPWLRGMLAAS